MPPEPIPIYQEIDPPASFARDVVLASFAADSISLGPHWIYDTGRIEELYPSGINELDTPRSEYHPGKEKGDFTHYGDQMFVQLEVLSEYRRWDNEVWMERWLAFWKSDPNSYLDSATRDVLDAWESEGRFIPSHSHDLAGASRMAPLLALLAEEPVAVAAAAAREQAASTHDDPPVVDAAAFFTRVIYAIREGASYSEAFQTAASEGNYSSDLELWLQIAFDAQQSTVDEVALSFGQSCAASKAFPLTLWLALAYEGHPKQMLEENALAGGDSSARGMILGMLIAASGHFSELPPEWTTEQNKAEQIAAALKALLSPSE